MKLLVLDGNSIINRAFYGIKLLTTKDGLYTNAIYGFMNIFLKLLADETPDETAIAFDLKAPTFRHKMYDGYKAQRKGMPEELALQMPILKDLLAALGYVIVTCEGYEADDILGTLAYECDKRGDECVIATGDRDSLQLITANVRVLLAGTKMGKSITTDMTQAAVQEKYGVSPRELIEVKSLMGDASDNIPGVAGVGEKTALDLIRRFHTLDGVYDNIDSPDIKVGVRAKLIADKANATMSRSLAEICQEAPVISKAGEYLRGEQDSAEAKEILVKLEMPNMITRLKLDNVAAKQADLTGIPQLDVLPLSQLSGKVYLAKSEGIDLAVCKGKVYVADEKSLLSLLTCKDAEVLTFDAKQYYHFAQENNEKACNITFDAKLAAYLLSPATSEYTVDGLAVQYGITPDFVCEYEIAGLLTPLFTALSDDCDTQGMTPLLRDIELPLCNVLADMEHTGIAVDRQGLEAFGTVLQAEIKKQLALIYEQVGREFNVNSPKQLGEALFEDLGLPTRKKTKSGYSTDAKTLESLRHYSPVIENILTYRTYAKLNSTYVEGLLKVIGKDDRVHSTFNQTETRTGRISSGEPNLQNIPVRTKLGRELRKFFIAKEGMVLLDADYSQIELRILAHISGDEAMCEVFRTGGDIHLSTAAKIHKLDPKDVTPALRSSAKAVNFGIVYGISAYGLAQDVGVSVKEAESFISNYLDTFSGVRSYMEDTVKDAHENGFVTTMFGRRRTLPELNSSNFNIRALGERMAMNTPIQGTAADIIKLAMIKVYCRLKTEGLTAKLILQVHDELIVECPLDEAKRASKILSEEMCSATELCVPLLADVNTGDTWYAAKG